MSDSPAVRLPPEQHAALGVEGHRHLLAGLHRLDRRPARSGPACRRCSLLLLVSLFLSLAIEPGVNRLARARLATRHGDRRHPARRVRWASSSSSSRSARWSASRSPTCCGNSEYYVNRIVNFINDTFDTHIDPAAGDRRDQRPGRRGAAVHRAASSGKVVDLSVTALGVLVKALSVLLFTFYLVADGPRLRRAICSRLRPDRQRRCSSGWELAIDKTGGYLYSRALLAGLSALFHWSCSRRSASRRRWRWRCGSA